MSRRALPRVASLAALAFLIPSALAAQFEGTITSRTMSLSGGALLALVDGDIERIEDVMEQPLDALGSAAGVEIEDAVIKVKGSVAYVSMGSGRGMVMNYETGEFTMADESRGMYATWTAEELRQMMEEMMPPGAEQGAMPNMQGMAGMMGGEPAKTEGPFALGRRDRAAGCTWYGVRKGDLAMSDDPAAMMQGASLVHGCMTDRYPSAQESYRRFGEMGQELEPMSGAGPDPEMLLAERGLPLIVKTLERAMMQPSYTLRVEQNTVTEEKVEIPDIGAGLRKVSMQEFMMGMQDR